ncbi:pimeloyl-ACP methyl ester carboxylesterase [Agromyces sp. 3263]|uniref:epoxide hydrolase family protein n=1 Tax=Agromyces sp. 3263 TaxID=2817750 RepID=UPI00285E1155|nr:alpha/beta fold hydrolase [Agromyces sp. 3263]MDR6907819.1 pimeloyl-ACP methyl ester carboxylesterase [Agromyces sp. 3263]
MEVTPYTIAISDAELADLHSRLERTRWPAALTEGWERGTPVPYARRLADHWRTGYDWRDAEARLNRLPQFVVEVDGQPIHGLHVRSADDAAVPLLLVHGYPSSFVEFARIAPVLAERPDVTGGVGPAPAFHVVAPSIPGFGFSTPLTGHGWDIARTARAFDELMLALGYDRYAVFGEDVGAGIAEQLCLDAGEHVLGLIAATDPGAIATQYTPPTDHLTAAEREHHERLKDARSEDFGYLALQTTRPLSVAYGLTDSPIAQATWIAEKFQEWTDPARDLPEDAVDLDDLLTLISVAWFGRGGDGAANLLYETAHAQVAWGRSHDRPQGIAAFGDEPLMRRILDPDGHLAFWNEHRHGGHFPAMEAPDDLVGDIRSYFARLVTV